MFASEYIHTVYKTKLQVKFVTQPQVQSSFVSRGKHYYELWIDFCASASFFILFITYLGNFRIYPNGNMFCVSSAPCLFHECYFGGFVLNEYLQLVQFEGCSCRVFLIRTYHIHRWVHRSVYTRCAACFIYFPLVGHFHFSSFFLFQKVLQWTSF